MSFIDRLLGRRTEPRNDWPTRTVSRRPAGFPGGDTRSGQLTDEQAVERYRYLLRTAPPDAVEQAHAEAFAQLTPEQRRMVLSELSAAVPPQERSERDDPRSLARMATRAEMRRPGTLERTFGGMSPAGMGVGLGGLMAGSFLSSIAGVVLGTAIADAIFDDGSYDQGYADGRDAADADQGADSADTADAGYDGGDTGFDSGDFGGDFGGGDFGGGEF
ncbi:MAG TPA: hypothetical protein VKB09_12810 [Thermomicrobiales bacterium]|nr:hypothetical protein [Thermomicrobiales bacterium]